MFGEKRSLFPRTPVPAVVSPYIDEAELLCERVGIINNGKLIAEDTVPNLKSSIDKSKLEDVFLELTGRTLND
jgi:ABC-2 type transport system ATP-binding protein